MSLLPNIIKLLQTTPRSLADLQPLAQVSLPTLRKAMQELSDARWVRVVGQSETNGGRPAMLFGLDDTYFSILGVHLQLPGLRMILSDLAGRVLHETEQFPGVQPGPDEVVHAIVDYAADATTRFPGRQILGVGLAAPGFTDPETGDIISIGRVPGWQHYPICQRVRASLNLPTVIANDIDCMAFAEFQQTGKSLANNLVYVGFDEGVKVSLFLNGDLYKGSFGNSGLIMSQFLRVPGKTTLLEAQQQILTISGINMILEQEVADLDLVQQHAYRPIIDAHYRKRLMLIFDSRFAHLPICRKLANELTTVLAAAITNVVHIIQPDTVVIGGVLGGISDAGFATLSSRIRDQLPTLFANRIQFEQARFVSPNSAALGAAYHFMENYITPETFTLSPAFLRT